MERLTLAYSLIAILLLAVIGIVLYLWNNRRERVARRTRRRDRQIWAARDRARKETEAVSETSI